jgi:hypothetical protein
MNDRVIAFAEQVDALHRDKLGKLSSATRLHRHASLEFGVQTLDELNECRMHRYSASSTKRKANFSAMSALRASMNAS